MGKGSKSSSPSAPDPYETASAESQFNRLDTYSPSGSGVRYGYTDKYGNFQQGVAPEGYQSAQAYIESPYEQQIREALEPASVALTNQIVDDNIYNLPDAARVEDRSDVAQDLFNRTFSLMAPGIEKSNETLLTNLQARGIPIGAEAFNDAYGEQQQQTQDTIARLAMDANLNAGTEQTRQFSLDQAERSNAISELVAAMGGGYNPPSSLPSGSATGVDYSGAAQSQYQAELAEYQANQQSKTSAMSTIGTLGAAAIMKSTRKAKDVYGMASAEAAAKVFENMPIFVWSYKSGERPVGDHKGRHVGPMAEDFQRMTGLGVGHQIDAVDYMGVMASALQNALRRISQLERMLFEEGDEEGRPDGFKVVRVH